MKLDAQHMASSNIPASAAVAVSTNSLVAGLYSDNFNPSLILIYILHVFSFTACESVHLVSFGSLFGFLWHGFGTLLFGVVTACYRFYIISKKKMFRFCGINALFNFNSNVTPILSFVYIITWAWQGVAICIRFFFVPYLGYVSINEYTNII